MHSLFPAGSKVSFIISQLGIYQVYGLIFLESVIYGFLFVFSHHY